MKKVKLLVAMLLVLIMAVPFVLTACNPAGQVDLNDVVERTDYTSVYDMIGSKVTIDMVEEDAQGLAYATVDGVKYELGMDFLSMAMVYNTTVPEGSEEYETKEDVYNEWWKLYIQRWNMLVPEVPLYSNIYYDVYNKEIEGLVTTPYWTPSTAIVGATTKDSASVVNMGDITDLSGSFRNSSFGKAAPGAADLAVQELTSGYSTLFTDMNGAFHFADGSTITNEVAGKQYQLKSAAVLAKAPETSTDAEGNITYKLTINSGLKFSDGSAITAKNYVASVLAYSTKVMEAAGGSASSGMYYVGYEEFNANVTGGASAVFSGIRLLSDTEFSVTISKDYANYYYVDTYASFSPVHMDMYFKGADIKDDGNGCYITEPFYASSEKDGIKTYAMAEVIKSNINNTDASAIPYSGPYVVSKYDASTKTATLTKNEYYTGDHRGSAAIQTITYNKIVSETQLDQLKQGEIDILAGVTGATDTEAALALTKGADAKFAETHYDRAGYGKLAFVSDFGPTMFKEVRQAVIYTINREKFATDFTGGHGAVVHGPYYTGSAQYQAVKDEIKLSTYNLSAESAIKVLEEGGWIYNGEGKEFDASKDAVRYKKLSGYELSYDNLNFASTDNKYKTVKINGEYYMPLVINWTGTQPNEVTDLLITAWQTSKTATSDIGMYITYKSGEFNTALYGDYYQMAESGFNGTARCGAVNFATGFTSSIYDYSFNWTINPDLYAQGYNMNMFMDEADFFSNYSK